MTKIVKFWMRFSFWTKVRSICAALGVSSEVALFVGDSHHGWKVFFAVVTILSVAITYLVEDKNKNDIIDILE